jgi:MinD-like ATPase involved in chromosome partitioning or flagellar assembly
MLVFATSDKGGTGRSVTGCNLAYRCAMHGYDVCYLDFDFGSPTAGAIFEVESAVTGIERGGLHSLVRGLITEPARIDVWRDTNREDMRSSGRPPGAGELVLFPGDRGGGEFSTDPEILLRCTDLFRQLSAEFEICFIDLSAGRSYAIDIALRVTANGRFADTRWLVFHRWTRQHIHAAAALVFGEYGLIRNGIALGHNEEELRDSVRFVRTAILDPDSPSFVRSRATQVAWLRECHKELQRLAADKGLGRTVVLGETPMDPVLQWREQLIADTDVRDREVANTETAEALDELARRLMDKTFWEGL